MKNIHVLPTDKEPVKGGLEKEMFELEQELDIPSHLRWHNSKPKQETLEEAALKWFMTANKREIIFDLGWIKIFEAGAKWQQERMYSKEDMEESFYQGWVLSGVGVSFKDAMSKFFEQFKNK